MLSNVYKISKIAILARKYLCVSATPVSSERSFSVGGRTITKRRAFLDQDKVDEQLFIHIRTIHFLQLPVL